MCWRFRAFVGAVLTLVWLAGPVWAQSRGVTVDDVVGLEAFGRASISPNGRWAVYEKRGRYDSAPRFDFGQRNGWLITDLWRVDLRHPDAPPRKLLPGEGPGLLRGAWSPSGDRILVTRFDGTRLEVGIASLADRSVRWTGLTPEMPPMGAASQWISDDRVLILAREEASLPWLLRYYGAGQTVTSEAWRRTAAGQVAARTVVDTDGRVATAEGEASRQMLLSVDVRTGEKRALFTGRIVDFSASPDGDRIALIEAEAPRPMPRGRLSQSETLWVQRFRILGGRTGEPLAAPVDFEPAPHLLRWSRDSRRLLVWGRANDQTWGCLLYTSPSPRDS